MFTIDSPNGGFSIGKIKNHLKQTHEISYMGRTCLTLARNSADSDSHLWNSRRNSRGCCSRPVKQWPAYRLIWLGDPQGSKVPWLFFFITMTMAQWLGWFWGTPMDWKLPNRNPRKWINWCEGASKNAGIFVCQQHCIVYVFFWELAAVGVHFDHCFFKTVITC